MTNPLRSSAALGISLRTAFILLLFTLAFTTLMSVVYTATLKPIATSAEGEKLRLIGEVLPATEYDNDLLRDSLELPATPELGLGKPSRAYLARKDGQPAALVLEAAAPDGYSGRIALILAVRTNGELIAVRVTEHKETPGLGDYIDPHKDKNKAHPWIRQFDQQSLAHLPAEQWRVKKDGGHFDQRSGATISARAVTQAVGRALQWVSRHHQTLFAPPTPGATP
ncbi:MAG: electron transport complex subunit RsxG [Sterolibacterium sp.]|nr:electron transport complex subunit RsxG [Sterolibacterium sp.]MBP9800193.1 electron transport complex subunit RsxG [Sterolibacterium sp.]